MKGRWKGVLGDTSRFYVDCRHHSAAREITRIPAKSVIYAHSLTRTIRAEAAVDAVHELLYCA